MPEETPRPHRRRVRYSGTHPRRFEQKYKELDPAKYADQIEHIIAKGLTPAGTHRPICVEEILEILSPKPGETAFDATLGYGGHARKLLPKLLPGGRYFAVDVDTVELPKTEARLRAEGYGPEVLTVRKMNYAGILGLLGEAGGGFDCVLADLGVSSMQLDNPERGFTYKADGPLDLRLNPERGQPASEFIKAVTADKLRSILEENADEPFAAQAAKAIKEAPLPVKTTSGLAKAVRAGLASVSPKLKEEEIKKSLQRVFQALRVEVNGEFSALDRFLEALPWAVKPGGRIAILTFHSGEDRRVKKSFFTGEEAGVYSSVAQTPARPSAAERRSNPRSSSAKLRWAVRSDRPAGGS
ncbi:MAG: 16S rRNA (cytosine(1402)-N(4))-methyltransferase RsmH [Elusimicrobia bacterium]|nr:16S rRNA (cytosine(1402)-N(4))-methyltransferase RsmH [Elusimicrobiota bacterium]